MAVDVPASFIARNKTPPRYPPPRPPSQVNPPLVLSSSRAQPQVPSTANIVKSTPHSFLTSFQTPSSTTKSNGNSRGGYDADISLELQPLHTFGKATNNHHHHHNHHHSHKNHHTNSTTSASMDTITASAHSDFRSDNKSLRSSKAPSSLESACESIGFDSMSFRTKSKGSVSSSGSSSSDLGPPEYDMGPHRELAVDVPDNFVEIKKSTPRYPPPVKMVPPPQLPPIILPPKTLRPPMVVAVRPPELPAKAVVVASLSSTSSGSEATDTSASTVSPTPTTSTEATNEGFDERDASCSEPLVRNNEVFSPTWRTGNAQPQRRHAHHYYLFICYCLSRFVWFFFIFLHVVFRLKN